MARSRQGGVGSSRATGCPRRGHTHRVEDPWRLTPRRPRVSQRPEVAPRLGPAGRAKREPAHRPRRAAHAGRHKRQSRASDGGQKTPRPPTRVQRPKVFSDKHQRRSCQHLPGDKKVPLQAPKTSQPLSGTHPRAVGVPRSPYPDTCPQPCTTVTRPGALSAIWSTRGARQRGTRTRKSWPDGEALPASPTRAGNGPSGAPVGDSAPQISRTHHTARAGPHLPTERLTDRPTHPPTGQGNTTGRWWRWWWWWWVMVVVEAWETKSRPTTGTLHGHASRPAAPYPATPGSRGRRGYHPPSPDASGLGKKTFPRRHLRRPDPTGERAGA